MRLRRMRRKIYQICFLSMFLLTIAGILFLQTGHFVITNGLHQKSLTLEKIKGFEEKNIDTRFVVYNRVPKCASMSMTTLAYRLGDRNGFTVASPYVQGERPGISIDEQQKFIDFLHQQQTPYMYIRHQYFIDFENFGEKQPIYINMIRDPVERFESFYFFTRFGNQRGGGASRSMDDVRRNENIDECVKNRRRECTNPYWQIVPYFCGQEQGCLARTQWAVDKAKENIVKYYLFVGVLEDLDGSLNILGQLLPSYFDGAVELMHTDRNEQMKNETVTVNKKQTGEEAKSFLRTQTSLALEYDLYNFVVNRMKQLESKLNLI